MGLIPFPYVIYLHLISIDYNYGNTKYVYGNTDNNGVVVVGWKARELKIIKAVKGCTWLLLNFFSCT